MHAFRGPINRRECIICVFITYFCNNIPNSLLIECDNSYLFWFTLHFCAFWSIYHIYVLQYCPYEHSFHWKNFNAPSSIQNTRPIQPNPLVSFSLSTFLLSVKVDGTGMSVGLFCNLRVFTAYIFQGRHIYWFILFLNNVSYPTLIIILRFGCMVHHIPPKTADFGHSNGFFGLYLLSEQVI